MRRVILSLVAIGLSVLVVVLSLVHAHGAPAHALGGSSPIPPQPVTYPNVLFLGDSITQGQHTDDFTYDYFWQVIVGLRSRSTTNAAYYLFDGVGGDTVGDYLAHLQALNLHPSNAQLIVLELGTNDYLQNVSPATMQTNYAALLARLVADNPQARLVALNVWGDPTAEAAYNTAIQQEAATWTGAGGSVLVDISTLYMNPFNHWPTGDDLFHPNDNGHSAIAQAVLAAV